MDQFANYHKPILSETEEINLGTPEDVREIKINIQVDQNIRDYIIKLLL